MNRGSIYLVTVMLSASEDVVHERFFHSEDAAKEWAGPFYKDRFRVFLQRFKRDTNYASPIPV